MGAPAAIAGLVLTAVGTQQQIKATRDAAEEQEDIAKQQAAVAAQKRIEERRANFRRRRIARARLLQASEVSGTSGSSGEAGAVGAIDVQAAAIRTGINVRETAEREISESQRHIAEAEARSTLGRGTAKLGTSIFDAAGGIGRLQSPPSAPGINIPQQNLQPFNLEAIRSKRLTPKVF